MKSLNINPWTSIWLHPKNTMRAILNWDPRRIIIWLAVLGGLISAGTFLGQTWQTHPESQEFRKTGYIIFILIAGGLLGLFHLYFGGWLYNLTSRWIGGKGDFTTTKSAVGWSNYPAIVANIFLVLNLVSYPNIWLQGLFSVLYLIAAIWTFIIFLNLIAEAQNFSAWRALLAVVIASVIIFVIILLIAAIIPLVKPLFSQPKNLT